MDSDGLLADSPPGHMVFLVQYFGLFQAALVTSILSRCSPTAVLGCRPAVCSLYLVQWLLLISPMHIISQLSHSSWYTTLIVVPWVFYPFVVCRQTMFLVNSLKLF